MTATVALGNKANYYLKFANQWGPRTTRMMMESQERNAPVDRNK